MKFINLRSVFVLFFAAGLGAALLHTSQSVQNAGDRLAGLERSVRAEREAVAVLRAEWEYLNTPQRLERLAVE